MSGRILHGAKEIAGYLQLNRRAVYHLLRSGRLPFFRLGTAMIHARQEALDRFIEEQEQRNSSSAANDNKPKKKSAA
jgi:excisionase family DNA binding protein